MHWQHQRSKSILKGLKTEVHQHGSTKSKTQQVWKLPIMAILHLYRENKVGHNPVVKPRRKNFLISHPPQINIGIQYVPNRCHVCHCLSSVILDLLLSWPVMSYTQTQTVTYLSRLKLRSNLLANSPYFVPRKSGMSSQSCPMQDTCINASERGRGS